MEYVTQLLPTMVPALPAEAHFALTVSNIAVYSVLFVFVYTQMWMILVYRHKRLSYQTVFLFLCLFWAALRITLFSFYFANVPVVNTFPMFWYWFLYSCPVCLQYITLVLLVVFFSQVVFKARARNDPNQYRKYQALILGVAVMSSVTYVAVNATCTVLARACCLREQCHVEDLRLLTILRVGVNDSLSVLAGFALAWLLYHLSKSASANRGFALEVKGNTVCQTYLACAFIIILYISKAVYNMVAVTNTSESENFWISVSDQADFVSLYKGYNYLYYGVALLVWEVLPTFIVTAFFRVQKPAPITMNLADLAANADSRAYFFDDPRLYDSDGDVTRHLGRQHIQIQGSAQSHSASLGAAAGSFRPQSNYYGSVSVNTLNSGGGSSRFSVVPTMVHSGSLAAAAHLSGAVSVPAASYGRWT